MIAHLEGELKAQIMAAPERFIEPDPEAVLALLDLAKSGKRLLLITNSGWTYTKNIMAHALDPHLPEGMTWRDVFELVIVGARKPAFFASDPNVGRLLMAVGRAKIDKLDMQTVCLSIDQVDIIRNGEPASDYSEARGQAVMDQAAITIKISLGRGDARWTIWTCDLSHEYVRINAEYRT